MIKKVLCLLACAFLANSVLPSENVTQSEENLSDQEDVEYESTTLEIGELGQQPLLKFATVCETPNHDPGFCIELSKCFVLSKQKGNIKAKHFLEESQCGPNNEDKSDPKVCCGKYNNYRNVSTHIVEDTTVFPKKCGVQKMVLRGRIVGGKKAALGEYPWMVRLIHKNRYGYKTFGCAGFLIHAKYVLTAAHCIESNFTNVRGPLFSVALGEHNIETKIDCSTGGTVCADPVQYSRVAKVIVHPGYNKSSVNHHNDIALIHLNKGARFSDFVQPICLWTHKEAKVNSYHLSGWGKTEYSESSPVKLKVDIDAYPHEDCQTKYSILNLNIEDTQICAGGQKQKDSCSGDSGGPLMMAPNGTTWYAAGVVSYGIGCGLEGWPGVYTNIPSYIEWIKTQMIANSIRTRSNFGAKKHKHKNRKNTLRSNVTATI